MYIVTKTIINNRVSPTIVATHVLSVHKTQEASRRRLRRHQYLMQDDYYKAADVEINATPDDNFSVTFTNKNGERVFRFEGHAT